MIGCKIRILIQSQQTILGFRGLPFLVLIFRAHRNCGNRFQLFCFERIHFYRTMPFDK